jgi:hypothetical protein
MERTATVTFSNTSAQTRWTHDFDVPDCVAITSQVMCVLLLNGSNNNRRCIVRKSSRPTRVFLLFGSVLTLTKPFGTSWNFATIWCLITTHFSQQIINFCRPTIAWSFNFNERSLIQYLIRPEAISSPFSTVQHNYQCSLKYSNKERYVETPNQYNINHAGAWSG